MNYYIQYFLLNLKKKVKDPTPDNIRSFISKYTCDKMGHMEKLKSEASNNNFTRHFNLIAGTNQVDKVTDNQSPANTLSDFTWDDSGNLKASGTTRNYEWDHSNQLRAYYNQTGTNEPSVYAHYLYDAGGNRVKKLVRTQGGDYETTVYVDDAFEYHYKEQNSNTYEKNYCHIMDDSSRIAMIRYGTAFPDDISNTEVYNLEDHLGSSSVRLDTNGAVIDKEEYYPFGDSSLRTFDKKRYRFTGKEKDSESGLYYFGARYYAAWTCRFISVDPKARQSDYQSSYAYGDNNPIVMNDPSGSKAEKVTGSKGGGNGGNKGNSGGDSGNGKEGKGNDGEGGKEQGNEGQSKFEKKKEKLEEVYGEKYVEESDKMENTLNIELKNGNEYQVQMEDGSFRWRKVEVNRYLEKTGVEGQNFKFVKERDPGKWMQGTPLDSINSGGTSQQSELSKIETKDLGSIESQSPQPEKAPTIDSSLMEQLEGITKTASSIADKGKKVGDLMNNYFPESSSKALKYARGLRHLGYAGDVLSFLEIPLDAYQPKQNNFSYGKEAQKATGGFFGSLAGGGIGVAIGFAIGGPLGAAAGFGLSIALGYLGDKIGRSVVAEWF
jgi:RHS repeat-associated protein